MALPITSGEFRLYDDPILRFTQSGKAVVTIPLIASDRKKNESTGEWEDTDVLALRATAWEHVAENVAESLTKGDLVTVTGKVFVRKYEHDGQQKQSVEMKILSIGPSLTFRKTPHGSQNAPQGRTGGGQQPQGAQQAPTGAQGGAQQPAWGGGSDEPPF